MTFSRQSSKRSAIHPPLSTSSDRHSYFGTVATADLTRGTPAPSLADASLLAARRGRIARPIDTTVGPVNTTVINHIAAETKKYLHPSCEHSVADETQDGRERGRKFARVPSMTGWLCNVEQSPFRFSFGEENFPWSSNRTVQETSTRRVSGIPTSRAPPFFGDEVSQQHVVSDGDIIDPGYDDDHQDLSDTEEWENAILTPGFIDLLQHTESDVCYTPTVLDMQRELTKAGDNDDWEIVSGRTTSSEGMLHTVDGQPPNRRLRRSRHDNTKNLRQRYLEGEPPSSRNLLLPKREHRVDEDWVSVSKSESKGILASTVPVQDTSNARTSSSIEEDIHRQLAQCDFEARRGPRRLLSTP